MADYTLHCFAQSGNAYKAALALELAGADWVPRHVDFTHLDGRRYVVGDRLTIADLSLCGYLFWPDEIGVDWTVYPAIKSWLTRIRSEPRWVHPYTLMPGHPLPAPA